MTVKVEKWGGKNEFFEACFQRFGSMNKNDYEVALFHLLMLNEDYAEKSDFEMSVKLQMPESKVKRLRYEESLVWPPQKADMDATLLRQMESGSFKLTTDRIQFSISDKALRLYLNDKLEKGKRFADSSFNSSIVSITADDLGFLLNGLPVDEKQRVKIIENIKDKIENSKKSLPMSAMEKLATFGMAVVKTVGGEALGSVVGSVCDELRDYLTK